MAGKARERRPRGRPPRTEQQRADRRQSLTEAAIEAVRRYGPDVTLDQMAELAEVSKPVLYAEFGDKNGVVDAMAVVLAGRIEETVVAKLAAARRFDVDFTIGAIIEALIDLIDNEPRLYAYIVRSLRMRDRGLLDNALVRVIHERAAFIIGHLAADLGPDELDMLADGVFGFVLGVVESWVSTRRPSKERLVAATTAAIRAGLEEVVSLWRTTRAAGA